MTEYLFGVQSVRAALLAGQRKVFEVLVDKQKLSALRSLEELAQSVGVRTQRVDERRIDELSMRRKAQGVVLRCGPKPVVSLTALSAPDVSRSLTPVVVALYRVHDPQNLGAIARSAWFFGAESIVLSESRSGTLSRITAAVSSASAGAAEFIKVQQAHSFAQFLEEARMSGWQTVCASVRPQEQAERNLALKGLGSHRKGVVLVLGNEHEGLPSQVESACTHTTTIPSFFPAGSNSVDSLNVGVAAGVLLSAVRMHV